VFKNETAILTEDFLC